MVFDFNYSENNNFIRSKTEVKNQIVNEKGYKLRAEIENAETLEVIWSQVASVLGKSFWSIEPDEIGYRFLYEVADKIDKYDFLMPIGNEFFKDTYSDSDRYKMFEEMITYARLNMINIFVHPSFQSRENDLFVRNLVFLKDAIAERTELLDRVSTEILSRKLFDTIGSVQGKIDDKSNKLMLKVLKQIQDVENGNFQQKKWWEFWK